METIVKAVRSGERGAACVEPIVILWDLAVAVVVSLPLPSFHGGKARLRAAACKSGLMFTFSRAFLGTLAASHWPMAPPAAHAFFF